MKTLLGPGKNAAQVFLIAPRWINPGGHASDVLFAAPHVAGTARDLSRDAVVLAASKEHVV